MRRKAPNSESAIATDSFLDIIANIVGILIILIVMAGVRVSQAPVIVPSEADRAVPETIEPEPPTELPAAQPAAPAVVETDPLPDLLNEAHALEREISQVEQEVAARERKMAALGVEEQQVRESLRSAAVRLKRELEALRAEQAETQQAALKKDELRGKLLNLQFALQSAQREMPPSKKLDHWVTPVSNTVQGKEMHFRLMHNRVSYLPVDELIERLRGQVERRKDWLVKFNRHQGQVGPVEGYTMNYTVQRQAMSIIDELRYGRQMIQIGVSEWSLDAERDVPDESSEEARSRGSRFIRKLQTTQSDTTVTFWVYPDSYGLYRQLQGLVHAEGLTVAARPIPFGVSISGSPRGTRSAGQ